MPRGIRKVDAAPEAPAVSEPPAMIFIEPGRDGDIRLNAYGMDGGEVVDVLRRSLLHMAASQAGVQVISLEVPRAAAVAVRPVQVAGVSRNGAGAATLAAPKPSKLKPRKRSFDERDEDYFTDGIEAAVGDER